MTTQERRAWIFVSHASEDLETVRRVRNYLEERDASPLLFHLLALEHQEGFWPLIEREIAARNFFLFCESEAARRSDRVSKEREAVRKAAEHQVKRIGSVTVDDGEPDFSILDDFIATTRVFPSYTRADADRVQPYLAALRARGFEVYDDSTLSAGDDFERVLDEQLTRTARHGWVAVFLSAASVRSTWIQMELARAAELGARFLPVRLDTDMDPDAVPSAVRAHQWFDAADEGEDAPEGLADTLHSRAVR